MQAYPYHALRFAMPKPPINLPDPICDSPVIAVYRRIVSISDAMREASLCQNWDDLVSLGKDYLVAVQELKACPCLDQFSADERSARARLLLEIIDNDALIRDLAQPEIARVGRLISRFSRGKNAVKAYHQPATNFDPT